MSRSCLSSGKRSGTPNSSMQRLLCLISPTGSMQPMPIARIENAIVRPLRSEDLSAALRLSAQAGWNQTYEDWAMLLDLAPEGCLAIEINGNLASTTTLLCYEKKLAWIG